VKQTTEHSFESSVETLLGASGWEPGDLAGWDVERALFPAEVLAFLQGTQPQEWAALHALHQAATADLLLAALVKDLEQKGMLHVLRVGFKCHGRLFRLAYFRPAHALNPDTQALYAANRLTVTRQAPCHPGKTDTVDLLFAVNGLPVATCELKNPGTGQTWRHAVKQYQTDRDPQAPLFRFKQRALVHFAADPDEVHMSTRLRKQETVFLPFNRGSHPGEIQCGAGNPPNPEGYRTAYFWGGILQRDNVLDLLGRFLFLERREERVEDGAGGWKKAVKEAVIFPRYHQIDAVTGLIARAREVGPGHNYLIQHSAGSGKTNSISWLAHRLANLHDAADAKVYDCVLVITDRRVLDRQLQDAVYQIDHAQGVVKAIDQDSKQLAAALIDGTKIVVTTLQKFPFVLRGLLREAGASGVDGAMAAEIKQAQEWEEKIAARRYAVIVDEAHSSQTGESARELKAILGAKAAAQFSAGMTAEDLVAQVAQSRGAQPNLSFFAFTATPKGKTLELFGTKDAAGHPRAFHIYSMRQAIEEGFILDVLTHYTTYAAYYGLVKAQADDPQVPKKKATRVVAKFMKLHPHNIAQKTAVIVEHFRGHVQARLGGRAKAMVVTDSRKAAVRYFHAFKQYLAEQGYLDVRPLVAFSGTVHDEGLDYTEPGLNIDVVTGHSISESQLPDRFASQDYHVLIVAEKYQTGFDQPLLAAMYVDRRLDGVQAVQTLSRLNRMIPGKEAPFVLDFVNKREDIFDAFKPYYDRTDLEAPADPDRLEALKHELDQAQVYHWQDVEAFALVFYRPPAQQKAADHQAMEALLQPAVARYAALPDEDARREFRSRLGAYVRLYAFLSQVLPYNDLELEKLYTYARFLLPKLPAGADLNHLALANQVELEYYRLRRTSGGAIDLTEGDPLAVKSPTEVGTGAVEDEPAPLSEVIKVLNDRFGTEFTEEDRLFFEQIAAKAAANEQVVMTAHANPLDKFQLGVGKLLQDLMIERLGENHAIVTRYLSDAEFRAAAFPLLARAIFNRVRASPPPPQGEAPG